MKRHIENRVDRLESESKDRLSPGEYWEREICDDLKDPQEPWEQWFKEVNQ